MELVKVMIILLCLAYLPGETQAQDNNERIRTGLISGRLTISPSYRFSDKQSYFYLHGNLEFYLSDRVSIAGESYYYLGKISSGNSVFKYNHNIFFGASYHFVNNNNDFYIGLQPGVSITKLNETTGATEKGLLVPTKTGIDPLISPMAGDNFYISKLFHFFIQTRLVMGEHNYDVHQDLSELRISAGLGYNLNAFN